MNHNVFLFLVLKEIKTLFDQDNIV